MSRRPALGRGGPLRAVAARLLAAAVLGAGCTPQAPEPAPPAVLRFSAVPDQAPDNVRAQHEGVVREACAAAGLRCELLPSPSYEAVVDRLGRGEIDVAYLGGVTYAQARLRHGVEPLVMRDVDLRFTTVVVVRADDPARELSDLKGRRFTYGNRTSTSGHVMARRRLADAGFVPERDAAAVAYSAGHDETLRRVAAGEADAGAVNATVFVRAQGRGDPAARMLRALWQSAPYVDYVWAARRGLPPALRARLRDGFLDLSLGQPSQREALERAAALGYLPAFHSDFEEVIEALAAPGVAP
ncbi:MAG TPA: phosphate/phosphite/phosphonate ABC transporter substrate-binding protein [Burkholderiaceae bacterium]|nr:phosphate/phosphite/phosphonate ABC transporter substrate-binding protein [Burkholderiaceae bacterium]